MHLPNVYAMLKLRLHFPREAQSPMKKNCSTLLQLSTLFIFSSLSFANLSYAEKIYTWKDESGKMHYTNNPALVPLKKDANIIKMKALPLPEPTKQAVNGEQLWGKLCAHCHNLTAKGEAGRRGLPQLIPSITDPNSTPEKAYQILQAAIDDNMDDLAKIKLNEAEIKAIVEYITQEVNLTIPVILDAPRTTIK